MKKVLKLALSTLLALSFVAAGLGCSSDAGVDGGSDSSGKTTPSDTTPSDTPADVKNAKVQIVEAAGRFNSAYIIFSQIDGASYKVLIDDKEIDAPLIRYYDEYVYYTSSEDANLQVSWKKNTHSKVVRADALGLAKGSHTMKVAAVSGDTTSEYSSATITVRDYDRSGFAFTDGKEPGAYNKDGTLKDGAVVIYLTNDNKSTVKATLGGSEYTGIAAITQAIKAKKVSTPVDIRVVGTVKAENNDLSCADMKSAYALGVKEAKNVTIEGVGHDATLFGAGVAAFKSENIEIANLGLIKWGGGKDGDGVSLKEDSYAWVHHCDYFYGDAGSDADQAKGDGSMDLKDNSNHVTISYNHFWDSGKMSLCGMKSESGPNYITYHHNWFDHSDSRHPRIRTMTVHVYNNYFDGNSKYGVGVTTGANCFVEGNFFRNANDPMMSSKQGTDARGSGTFSGEAGGVIKSWDNFYTGNSNWASAGGSKNENGRKLQFITNKYDYTNGTELGEYKEWTATLGTDNGDGSWTIYDSKVSDTEDTIAKNSLIAVEDALKKGAYYQTSKGKTAFYIDVPANTKSITVTAKCGSSGKTGTEEMLSVNGVKKTIDLAATDYADFTFEIALTSNSTIEIKNTSSANSLNIRGIKVVAASGWETKLTSGADMTNIDAYEVDKRDQQLPDSVKAKSGGATYSNFDVTMGNSGLGLTNLPTGPEQAKKDVLANAGRYNADYAWTFSNETDDASYALNEPLNNELKAYKSGVTKILGSSAASSSETPSSGGDTPAPGGDTPSTPLPTGAAVVALVTNGSASPSDARVTLTSCSVNAKESNGAIKITYNEVEYTTVKMESSSQITVKATAGATITVVGSLPSGKQNCFKVGDKSFKLAAKTTTTTTFEQSFTATGNDVITKGDTAAIGVIVISE